MTEDILRVLKKYEKFGSKLGLSRMRELLARLGNPEKQLRVIHVAGTNGKGSVCSYISGVLMELGYSTGVYTSPVIEDFNERIRVDGVSISDDELAMHTERVVKAADEMVADGMESPTEFEVITAIAFQWLRDRNPDFAVVEVGLGGTGDSTNVIEHPLISIITSISYDHMDVLGNTIAEIAGEKAGIIKAGCPVVALAKDREAREVIARRAYELSAPLTDVSRIEPRIIERGREHYMFSATILGSRYDRIEISMPGVHQVENALVALTALEVLRRAHELRMDGEAVRLGMEKARQPGRFEIRGKYIFDGAHNEEGAAGLARTMRELYPDARVLSVVGVLSDKNAEGIIRALDTFTDEYIITEPPQSRRFKAEDFVKHTVRKATVISSADDALRIAKEREDDFDIILVSGSLYLVGYLRRIGGMYENR